MRPWPVFTLSYMPKNLFILVVTFALFFSATIAADDAQSTSGPLRLLALDVGEGQAILLQRGQHGLLIDTGHAGKARYVLDRLDHHGITHIDYLILTHLHPDHASGYFRIREAFPDMIVLDNHLPPHANKQSDMVRWLSEALAKDEKRKLMQAGDNFSWQGIMLRALWPPAGLDSNMNDSSLVIEVNTNNHHALIMGDAGNRVEQQLIHNNSLHGPYDILVAGHHASARTASNDFLSKVNPAYTLISINAHNVRGYPAAETLKRLQSHTRKSVFKTYQHGEICMEWLPGKHLPILCRS